MTKVVGFFDVQVRDNIDMMSRRKFFRSLLRTKSFFFVASILCIGVVGLGVELAYMPLPVPATTQDQANSIAAADINHDFASTFAVIRQQEDLEAQHGVSAKDDQAVQQDIGQVELSVDSRDYRSARQILSGLQQLLPSWSNEIKAAIAAKTPPPPPPAPAPAPRPAGFQVPILIYHYPPPDFEAQLQYLVAHHYTVIDFDQLVAAFGGAPLPPKPVILTFDDGFEVQMQAFALLQKYNMKATFFIIDGGPGSSWCIGAGRNYDQPQPCGDAYLTWDQVRQLDRSGLITIGSHTIDHVDLPKYPASTQSQEIIGGKQELEQELGHPVYYFAYPYGTYDSTTLALVRQAGFKAAVSTLPGTFQTPGNIYTLRRVRTTIGLP